MTQKSLKSFTAEPQRSSKVAKAPKKTESAPNVLKKTPEVPKPSSSFNPSEPQVSNTALWIDTHTPKTVSELAGHTKQLAEIRSWFSAYRKKSKPLLLHGPSGTGKTSLVYALAHDHDLEVVEMNASDFRTKALIEEKIGHAIQQRTLLMRKGKLILIDEIDGLYGTSDRGGVPTLIKLVQQSPYPIILTANNLDKQSLRPLKAKSKVIALGKVDLRAMVARLKHICERENVQIEESVLTELARRADGDLRGAINDLQVLSYGSKQITAADVETISSREKDLQVSETLLAIFKTKDYQHVMQSIWGSDKNQDELILWLAENIPREYETPDDIARAYDALSRADMFKGRIVHNQAWTLMKYVSEHIGFGVAAAKHEKYSKTVEYRFPGIIAKMGRSKFTRATRDAIASKIGAQLHCSKRRAAEQFPYLGTMLRAGDLGLELTPDEKAYF